MASATVGVHHQFHRMKLRTFNWIESSAQQQQQQQDEVEGWGKVRAIPAKDAAQALRAEGYKILDVRPAWEWEKARVVGSVHVPLFVEDKGMDPVTLLKKWVHFGYIGLWTGQLLTTINDQFLAQVQDAIDDDEAKLLVACGEGLRSRIALKVLGKGGYKNLAWLAGGFNRSKNSDFPDVEGSGKLQFATIGGVSYLFLQLLLILQVLGKDSD